MGSDYFPSPWRSPQSSSRNHRCSSGFEPVRPKAYRRCGARGYPRRMFMRDGDSLIKARYALTILRVAQGTDRQTAARLIWGLARDRPHPNERPEIARLHLAAINSFAPALNDRLISGGRVFGPAPQTRLATGFARAAAEARESALRLSLPVAPGPARNDLCTGALGSSELDHASPHSIWRVNIPPRRLSRPNWRS